MPGHSSVARMRHSRAKRSAISAGMSRRRGIFSATCRSKAPSARRASHTSAMPPEPSGSQQLVGAEPFARVAGGRFVVGIPVASMPRRAVQRSAAHAWPDRPPAAPRAGCCTSGWSSPGSDSSQTRRAAGASGRDSSSNSPGASSVGWTVPCALPYSIAACSISRAFSHSRCTVRSVTSSVSAISCSL